MNFLWTSRQLYFELRCETVTELDKAPPQIVRGLGIHYEVHSVPQGISILVKQVVLYLKVLDIGLAARDTEYHLFKVCLVFQSDHTN